MFEQQLTLKIPDRSRISLDQPAVKLTLLLKSLAASVVFVLSGALAGTYIPMGMGWLYGVLVLDPGITILRIFLKPPLPHALLIASIISIFVYTTVIYTVLRTVQEPTKS